MYAKAWTKDEVQEGKFVLVSVKGIINIHLLALKGDLFCQVNIKSSRDIRKFLKPAMK